MIMKHLFYIICTLVLLTGCSRIENENSTLTEDHGINFHLGLVDVQFNGETHEYVQYKNGYGRSLSHWEGCKYCKHSNNQTVIER